MVNDAAAATGPATLVTTFSISAPGADLPDFVDVAVNNPGNYAPVTLNFTSTTIGLCPNGGKLSYVYTRWPRLMTKMS
ncbi:MAG: hypothetical protein MZV70_00730 [Desulfobacterales bacterium]|nr:hypothetical protein [Desulfobacterales bacterium]